MSSGVVHTYLLVHMWKEWAKNYIYFKRFFISIMQQVSIRHFLFQWLAFDWYEELDRFGSEFWVKKLIYFFVYLIVKSFNL